MIIQDFKDSNNNQIEEMHVYTIRLIGLKLQDSYAIPSDDYHHCYQCHHRDLKEISLVL